MLSEPLPVPSSPRERALVDFIAHSGMVDFGRIVDRFFRRDQESLLEAAPRAESALQRLVLKGYLSARPLVLEAENGGRTRVGAHHVEHQATTAYSVTSRTSWSLNLPPSPTLRENFVQHHLKTLDALAQVEKQQLAAGGRVLGFKMESQLVQEHFTGKVFNARTQEALPKFPDAQLTVQLPDGKVQHVNVEYVSAKYTDEMIARKAAAWRGQATVWAVPNAATAARVRAVTGADALAV